MVGDEHGGVQYPADRVIDHVVWREGTVTTFVSQHPHASADEALADRVDGPSHDAQGQAGQLGDLGGKEGHGCNQTQIPGHVGQAT